MNLRETKWLMVFLFVATIAQAQTTINVMSYNTLNYPNGEIENRVDTLKVITDYVQPDLLLLQELKTETGLNTILSECFGEDEDVFASSIWVPQQSNQNSSWPLQQALIYNTTLFGMADEGLKTSVTRDLNTFKLYFKDPAHLQGDTTFLYVFVTHLKSSQGTENEQTRLSMMETFTTYFNTLPSDALAIFGGDFNVYTSTEPAYQLIISDVNNLNWEDPIDAPGNWHSSSYPFKQILTQSTREQTIFGDGAGGGMDDRFDFVMASEQLMNPASTIHYAMNSYEALGNTGDCYNQTILDCDENNPIPYSVLSALYYMSDHLPVILELETNLTVNIEEQNSPSDIYLTSISNDQLKFFISGEDAVEMSMSLLNSMGQQILHENQKNINGKFELDVKLQSGWYIAQILLNGAPHQVKFIVQ